MSDKFAAQDAYLTYDTADINFRIENNPSDPLQSLIVFNMVDL